MTILKDGKQLQNAVLEMVKAISKCKEATINDTSTYNNGVMDMKTFLCKPELIDRSNLSKLLQSIFFLIYKSALLQREAFEDEHSVSNNP